jgi:hypothetical protein
VSRKPRMMSTPALLASGARSHAPLLSTMARKNIAWYFLYVLYMRLSSTAFFGRCTRMYVASTMPMQSRKSRSPRGAASQASCSASVHPSLLYASAAVRGRRSGHVSAGAACGHRQRGLMSRHARTLTRARRAEVGDDRLDVVACVLQHGVRRPPCVEAVLARRRGVRQPDQRDEQAQQRRQAPVAMPVRSDIDEQVACQLPHLVCGEARDALAVCVAEQHALQVCGVRLQARLRARAREQRQQHGEEVPARRHPQTVDQRHADAAAMVARCGVMCDACCVLDRRGPVHPSDTAAG